MEKRKVVIVGSGPAGYTAAIYAARANLEPLIYEGFMSGPAGGQLMSTTDVENFPGFPEGVTGPELMMNFRKQAERFGTKLLTEDVKSVDFSSTPFKVKGNKTETEADTVIIATGATARRLDVPGAGEDGFWQRGVTACAVCDGALPLFRDKKLYVVGGGDTAMEEALFLTNFGSEVHIVHRRDEFRASKIMSDRAIKHPKITVHWNRQLAEVKGDKAVESVVLEDTQSGETEELEAAGVFFAIGHVPNTAFLDGQLETDETGYLLVEKGSCKTNVEGVFAAGDVQDKIYRQAITAAGSGCMAALEVEHFLGAKGLI